MDTTTRRGIHDCRTHEAAAGDRTITVTWEPDARRRPRSIAIGSFDGVHVGHRRVIGSAGTVLTFDPHPLRVLRPEAAPPLLTVLSRKAARLAQLGVTEVIVVPFDARWAALDARSFIDEVLVGRLDARRVSVGANFRFGARGAGDPDLLRADPRFTTAVSPLLSAGDGPGEEEVISSTRIRRLVADGELEGAARLLGSPLTQPAHIDADGRVNFEPTLALPAEGHYRVTVAGRPAVLTMSSPARIRLHAGCRQPSGVVAVTFLRRLRRS